MIEFKYYLYNYDDGELIGEYDTEKERDEVWDEFETDGAACIGGDTNSLLHNLAVELYRKK